MRAPDKPMLRLLVAIWGWLVVLAPAGTAQRFVGMRFIGRSRPAALDRFLHRLGLVRRISRRPSPLIVGE
jgi:hypothetical protein